MNCFKNNCPINDKNQNDFLCIKWTDYVRIAKSLSPSGLNLYMYLVKNQNDSISNFDSKKYCETFNVVDRTYRNARSELVKEGYLREKNNELYFNSDGNYKEIKGNLKEKLLRIGNVLMAKIKNIIKNYMIKLKKQI